MRGTVAEVGVGTGVEGTDVFVLYQIAFPRTIVCCANVCHGTM